ncbi:MAG TPA: FGGY family carbohydrate kinase [Solirubrobacterales bacterium]|jgi:xylulokinase|nr:FGGY family carbohydrate kinase [Solirubrobacterales bacterium]
MGAHTIGMDVGSQSVKGCLLDPDGDVVAVGRRGATMRHPASGWAEQDPAEWETGLTAVVAELLERGGVKAAEVGQLGLACQVDGVVPVDAELRPLRDALIWLDRRAEAEAAELLERVGERELFELTGLNCNASHTAPKMMWLHRHEPEVYGETRWLPAVGPYLVARLTGEMAIDHANASSTLLYDVGEGVWSERLAEAAGIDLALLPAIRDSTDVAGVLTAEAAARLGLSPDCRVVVGTGDDHGAALAAGLLRPGPIADVTGTAEPVATVAEQLTLDEGGLVETHAHAVPRALLVENPGFVSGGSTLWLAESVIGCPQADVFELAGRAEPGAGGVLFLPTLSGAMAPRWNDRMRGAFAGLGMNHGQPELARAVLEGCAFALRDVVDRLESLGLGGEEVRVVGGGARSPLWLQIKADVLDRPVRPVLAEEPTALGAALLAALAGGSFGDFDEAIAHGVDVGPAVRSDPARAALYAERHAAYRRLYDGVEGSIG